MGQAAVRPGRETVLRRALAWALALAANGVLIALIVLAPRSVPAPTPLNVVDLVLVAARTPEVEPVERPPEIAAEPAPRRVEPVREQTIDAPSAAPMIRTSEDEEDEVEEQPDHITTDRLPDGAFIVLPPPPAPGGTSFVLREIFCMTSSDATREAGDCPGDRNADGLALLRYATGAANDEALQAALGLGLSSDQIRALFAGDGLPLADLTGESTLADTAQRPTSSSDEMRDSLPPRHPDPAFGD